MRAGFSTRFRVRVVAVVFLFAAVRGEWAVWFPRQPSFELAWSNLSPYLPDLETAGRGELTLLPGLGPARALSLVRNRPFLGLPLTARRLSLLPGFGESSAAQIQAWYAADGILWAPIEWTDEPGGVPLQHVPNAVRSPPGGSRLPG